MKYKSISFVGTSQYSFIKYTEEYREQLAELQRLNYDLAERVEKYPVLYDEGFGYQAYMICDADYNCIGAISIVTSSDKKDLVVKMQIDENKIRQKEGLYVGHEIIENKVYQIINQAVQSLKIYFYDKENIAIILINQIDLYQKNPSEYKKVMTSFDNFFKCQNAYHSIIPKLLNEMTETKNNLSVPIGIELQHLDEWHTTVDKELMDSYRSHNIPFHEIFQKATRIEWNFFPFDNNDSIIETIFNRDGAIEFHKKSKNADNQINYDIFYHVNSSNFRFSLNLKQNQFMKKLFIEDNNFFTLLENNDMLFQTFKETGRKKITYTSPRIENTSIKIDIVIDTNNQIEVCNIDFRTHRNLKTRKKPEGKINGTYCLRLKPNLGYFSVQFLSRTGNIRGNFKEITELHEQELYSTIQYGELTVEMIDKTIQRLIKPLQEFAQINDRTPIIFNPKWTLRNIFSIEEEEINFLKQIVEENPLPHLEKEISNFIEKYQIPLQYSKNVEIGKQKRHIKNKST